MVTRRSAGALQRARESYITQWGALGSSWGISRTMSQIHALLMVSTRPLNTDEIMAELEISRGNAHGNLKELISWGLVRPVLIKGQRKEHFEAEKDVWQVVQCIIRERKRKELDPVLRTLEGCLDETKGLRGTEARTFRRQLNELLRFARLGDRLMSRVAADKPGLMMSWIRRFLG